MTAPRIPSSTRDVPRGLWWLTPAGAALFISVPTILLANAISDEAFRTAWGTPKFLTSGMALLFLMGIGVFMAASAVPLWPPGRRTERTAWPGLSQRVLDRLSRAATWLFWLTAAGYVVYFGVGFARGARPGLLLSTLVSQDNLTGDIEDLFTPIPGVTTLTQVGIAYVVVAVVVGLHGGRRLQIGRLAVIGFLALLRGFFLTERLAIIEIAVPAVALLATALAGHPRWGVRAAVRWLPVVLAPLAIVVFGVFEYSRSWQFYQSRTGGSYVDFAIDRFAGYYVTAYNNGAVAQLYDHSPGRLPLRTLAGFWDAPGIAQLDLYSRLSPAGTGPELFDLLTLHANPEFNNSCGLCEPFVDFGDVGGLVWWAVAGVLLGVMYRAFANGSLWGLLLYPGMVTGLLELPRYLYWVQGRWVPALVALLVTWWYAQARGSPDPAPVPVPPAARRDSR